MEGFTSLHASRAAVVAEAVGATVVFGEMAFGIAHERSGINGIAYFLLIERLDAVTQHDFAAEVLPIVLQNAPLWLLCRRGFGRFDYCYMANATRGATKKRGKGRGCSLCPAGGWV